MDAAKPVKTVHIINKFGPHDNAITGRSAGKLADVLTAAGHKVIFFCLQDSYKTLGGTASAKESAYEVIALQQRSFGKNGVRRLLSALSDGLRLTRRSVRQPADFVILMTDPPLLYLWSGLHRRQKGRKLIYWTMDLYPEAFVASGLVSPRSTIYRSLHRRMYRNTPFGIIALGPQQLQYLQKAFVGPFKNTILPCGIENIVRSTEKPEWLYEGDKNKLKFCYSGNVGEAHDEQFLITFIKALQPEKHVLYLNVYGAKAQQVTDQVQSLPVVRNIGYIAYGQMHFADVHLASLLSHWDHVCVPSKAVSAISAGSVLLLNSSKDCDNWQMFSEACFNLQKNGKGYEPEVQKFLETITPQAVARRQQAAAKLAKELLLTQENAYTTILNWLKE